jgi:hypothetical protein
MNSAVLESPESVIAKAWADEDFKATLLADPKAALKAQGIDVPDGVTLNVYENTDQVIHLVLPKLPELALVGEALDGPGDVGACGCHGCGGGGGCHGCGGCGCGGGCSCGGGGVCICW